EAFQNRLQADAEMASKMTGIPAKFMLAQAALETGWGKKEIVTRDGRSAHNLFGIKATGNWTGKVVEATTIEYINGKPQKRVEKFRAYDS
ncbi:glucosaminidase domain-containing protein, partial [Acinetobacter baumannii]